MFTSSLSMSMTCHDLEYIFETAALNDGSSSCCIHSDDDQSSKTLVNYQKSCEYVRNLYEAKECCSMPLSTQLGFEPSCKKNRICIVNPSLVTRQKTCTHRICQARTLTL